MTPERHEQIGELYHRVLALPREQWPAVLDEACEDDPELRQEVESLLAASDKAGSFMDTPAIDISARSLSADASSTPRRIGRYELLSLLGRGGMGEVHLAEDTTLRRKVAIKLLPAPLTTDAHAVLRFEQEARAASSLNHPNIVTIHEIGEVDGGRFIAMEFVEGRPLSALVGTPMPLEQLVPIARQLAQALAVAHAAGIVHRDIKPENIMLRPDGYVKLLDFGIARLVSPPTGPGDGVAVFATRAGVVVGTPRYMSPEQIRGEPATAASDVFALGAALFELATGQHASERQVSTAASALPSHGALGDLIHRMLDQNPAVRPRAPEIAAALPLTNTDAVVASSATDSFLRRRRWLIAGGTAAVLAAAAVVPFWSANRSAPEPQPSTPVLRQIVPPPNTAFSPSSASLALSPDGKSLAFTASQVNQPAMGLFIQSLDSLTPRAIPAVKTAGQLFWLPDSQSLAFADTSARFALQVVDIARGSVQPIENALLGDAGVGSASREHGMLVRLEGEATLHQIPRGGGAPIPATFLDASREETEHRFPVFLPDGRHFLFLTWSTQPEYDGMAYVGVLGSTERRPLFKSDSQVVYAHPGYLLYMLGDTLLARPFDATTLRVTGEGRPLADQVERNSGSRRGAFTVSQTGVLAYRQHGETQLAWYDRTGRRLQTLGPPGHYRNPALSPDGKTIAIARLEDKGGTWDIWTIDVDRQALVPVTSAPSSEDMPVWSPDGTELAYKSDRPRDKSIFTYYRQRLTDLQPTVLMGNLSGPNGTLHSWTSRGLLYSGRDRNLQLQPPSGDPVMLAETNVHFWEPFAQFSPDGKWLAYVSNETGAFEVYLTQPGTGHGRTSVSVGGGTEPAWRKDGRELFYLSVDRHLMAVPISDGQELRTGTARALFQPAVSALVSSSYHRNQYVVSADGQRFLINEPTGKGSLAAITVVVNWPALLRK
jgi:eukaryotic-like serine/threonine-protein kinase